MIPRASILLDDESEGYPLTPLTRGRLIGYPLSQIRVIGGPTNTPFKGGTLWAPCGRLH